MRYWLTVHWPKLPPHIERYPLRVWIQDGKESAGEKLSVGDRVLVYETKYGPTRRLTGTDGTTREVASPIGKHGIVAVAEATSALVKNHSFEKFKYAEGSERWWCWHASLIPLHEYGYVPRTEVNRVLGYGPKYQFRGFGAQHSGLKEIAKEEYEALLEIFKKRD